MAVKVVQKFTRSGGTPTFTAATSGGDAFPIQGAQQKFHFKNSSGAPITVTFHAGRPCNQGFFHDLPEVVPAGGEAVFDQLDPGVFADDAGLVQLTYSSVTGLTLTSY